MTAGLRPNDRRTSSQARSRYGEVCPWTAYRPSYSRGSDVAKSFPETCIDLSSHKAVRQSLQSPMGRIATSLLPIGGCITDIHPCGMQDWGIPTTGSLRTSPHRTANHLMRPVPWTLGSSEVGAACSNRAKRDAMTSPKSEEQTPYGKPPDETSPLDPRIIRGRCRLFQQG